MFWGQIWRQAQSRQFANTHQKQKLFWQKFCNAMHHKMIRNLGRPVPPEEYKSRIRFVFVGEGRWRWWSCFRDNFDLSDLPESSYISFRVTRLFGLPIAQLRSASKSVCEAVRIAASKPWLTAKWSIHLPQMCYDASSNCRARIVLVY